MKSLFVLFIGLLSLVSCSSDKPQKLSKPKGLLGEKKMVEIMADLQLVEAAKTMHYFNPDNVEEDKRRYMQEVYVKHEVTDSVFLKSLKYYSGKEKKMLEIYEEVIELLQTKQEEYR